MTENNNPEKHMPNSQDCAEWLEMEWWTPEEAWFALLGLPPLAADNASFRMRAMEVEHGRKIKDLIDRGVTDYKVIDLSFSGFYRAPCKSWIIWAKTKKSIAIHPPLLQAFSEKISEQDPKVDGKRDFCERNFHPNVIKHAKKFYMESNFANAVFEPAKAFEKAVKEKSKIEDFGESLMSQAFSLKKGSLKLNKQSSESERNEQEGLMHLVMGFMKAIKNPQSHEPISDWPISKNDTLDLLSFLSFLWRQLDKCQYEPRP